MTTFARTIGGPGSGKTRRALEILDRALTHDHLSPLEVGFVSFTRAARREASIRAADAYDCKPADLEKDGFFRTLHSIAYRQLSVAQGELITGTAEDNQWLREALDDETAAIRQSMHDDDYLVAPDCSSSVAQALSLWDHTRNRLMPVSRVWEAHQATDDRLPDVSVVEDVIARYEDAKATDGRLDFCDLLMRFAGLRWSGNHEQPLERCRPDGLVPTVPVYLHDEAQDMSALTAVVFRRLIEGSKWAYLLGDDWQVCFDWCGADGTIFASWPVAKQEMLPVSHRCRRVILEKAQAMMNAHVDHPRRFLAEHDGGEVVTTSWEEALAGVKPGVDTLVLARTNDGARECARFLDDALVPWKPIKGGGGFAAPARLQGVQALLALRAGQPIDGEGMWRLFDLLPSKKDGVELLRRGTKTKLAEKEGRDYLCSTLATLDLFGATEALKQALASDGIFALLDPAAARMAAAGARHGAEAIQQPACRVGTLHASKGLEADRVVVVNAIPYPTQKAIETEEGLASERRLWYVGGTRARFHLTVAETGIPFPEM